MHVVFVNLLAPPFLLRTIVSFIPILWNRN